MQKSSSKKPLLIIIAVIIVALGFYFYTSGEATNSDLGLLTSGAPVTPTSEAGERVLVLLRQVKGLKIDTTFFKTPAYSSLVDHTVPIYPQNIGKPNPFYSRAASVTAPAQTSTQRLPLR